MGFGWISGGGVGCCAPPGDLRSFKMAEMSFGRPSRAPIIRDEGKGGWLDTPANPVAFLQVLHCHDPRNIPILCLPPLLVEGLGHLSLLPRSTTGAILYHGGSAALERHRIPPFKNHSSPSPAVPVGGALYHLPLPRSLSLSSHCTHGKEWPPLDATSHLMPMLAFRRDASPHGPPSRTNRHWWSTFPTGNPPPVIPPPYCPFRSPSCLLPEPSKCV